jgi:hypothetical protein
MDQSKRKLELLRSFIHSSPMLGRFFLHGFLHATSPGSGFDVRLVSLSAYSSFSYLHRRGTENELYPLISGTKFTTPRDLGRAIQ